MNREDVDTSIRANNSEVNQLRSMLVCWRL